MWRCVAALFERSCCAGGAWTTNCLGVLRTPTPHPGPSPHPVPQPFVAEKANQEHHSHADIILLLQTLARMLSVPSALVQQAAAEVFLDFASAGDEGVCLCRVCARLCSHGISV